MIKGTQLWGNLEMGPYFGAGGRPNFDPRKRGLKLAPQASGGGIYRSNSALLGPKEV